MSRLADGALRLGYRVGWTLACRVPEGWVARIAARTSRRTRRRNGQHVQTLRRNLAAATGAPVTDALVEAGLASYLRTLYEVLALPGWSAEQAVGRVSTVGEDILRSAFAAGGAVVALPHSGNWDLAGAWACRTGMPVTTVAEQLADAEFRAFARFRQGLGMEVISQRDPGTVPALAEAIHQGRLVCLVADRDLGRAGLPVTWRGQPVTMPAGPAMVARRTGAALIPAVCHYTPTGMTIVFGPVVAHQPGRSGLEAMTQQVADFFAARIAEHPEDWHMMQPFFGQNRGPASPETAGPAPTSPGTATRKAHR